MRADFRSHRRRLPALCALLLSLWCAWTPAAPVAARVRVVLPTDGEAAARLQTADRLIEREQWQLALPLLQGVIEASDAALVQGEGVYRPARRLAAERIARLPAAARQTYQVLYGPAAGRLLERGLRNRSAGELRRAAGLYLNTREGVRALAALAALYIDDGAYGAALRALTRADLLTLTPEEAAPLIARRILCLAHLGRRDQANELAEAWRSRGLEQLRLGGRNWTPDELARVAFQRYAPRPEESAETTNAPRLEAALTVELPFARRDAGEGPCRPTPYVCAADTAILVNREGTVFCVDARSAHVRWADWGPVGLRQIAMVLTRDPREPDATPPLLPVREAHRWRRMNRGLETVATDGRRAFAVHVNTLGIATPDKIWEADPAGFRLTNILRCSELATGRILWQAGGAASGPTRGLWFFSAPALADGRAYVLAARDGRLRAVCLEAATGRLLWESPIGPIESRQEVERFLMEFYLADASPPAVAEGVAVFPTGQGVVCGFDARDGSLQWAVPYARAERMTPRLGQSIAVPTGSWDARAPLVSGTTVLLTPLDSRQLLALDVREGAVRWRRRFGGGRRLLGLAEGRVYVQHTGLVGLDASTGETVWETGVPGGAAGSGALGGSALYVPIGEGLRRWCVSGEGDGDLLRWPPAAESQGDLTWTPHGLVNAEEDRVTIYPTVRPAYPAAALWQAATEEPATAARRLEAALSAARKEQDPWRRTAALRQCGAGLLRLAARSGRADLLDGAAGLPPDDARTRAALAEAQLAAALNSAQPPRVVHVYADLVAQRAMEPAPGAHASVSLWARLAQRVRRAPDQAALQAAFRAVTGPEGPLPAQHSPYQPREQPAHQPVHSPPPGGRGGAPRLVRRGRRTYRSSEVGGRLGRETWSAEGWLIAPAEGTPVLEDRILVLEGREVVCRRPADGRELWRLEGPGPPVRDPAGAGRPTYFAHAGGLTIVLHSALLGTTPDGEGPLWAHRNPSARPLDAAERTVPRGELVARLKCGLPAPPADRDVLVPMDSTLCGAGLVCRIRAGRSAQVISASSGEALGAFAGGRRRALSGVRAGLAGDRLCLLLPADRRLLVLEPGGRRPTVEWRLRGGSPFASLATGPDGRVIVADWEAVYVFDTVRPRLVRRTDVPEGVEELLWVSPERILVRTLAGSVSVLDAQSGRELWTRDAQRDARTAWAARRGNSMYLLEVGGYEGQTAYGPEDYWRGTSWRLRAVDAETGRELWAGAGPEDGEGICGPPLPWGGGWLIRWSRAGRLMLTGVNADSGAQTFATDVSLPAGPAPAPLLTAGGRVIVGQGGRVTALELSAP